MALLFPWLLCCQPVEQSAPAAHLGANLNRRAFPISAHVLRHAPADTLAELNGEKSLQEFNQKLGEEIVWRHSVS